MKGSMAFTATPASSTNARMPGDFAAKLSLAVGFSSPRNRTNPPKGNQFSDQSMSLMTNSPARALRTFPTSIWSLVCAACSSPRSYSLTSIACLVPSSSSEYTTVTFVPGSGNAMRPSTLEARSASCVVESSLLAVGRLKPRAINLRSRISPVTNGSSSRDPIGGAPGRLN